MAEYIFTNLPQYVRITPRSDFSSSVVSSGAVLLFSEDGTTLTGKLSDGTFITIGDGTDVSDTTATAATVLSGYDFYNASGVKTSGSIQTVTASASGNVVTVPAGYIASAQTLTIGTAVAAQTITPGTVDQTIAADSFLSGAITIKGDANLIAANIASGVTIFGVTGTHQGGGGGSTDFYKCASVTPGSTFYRVSGAGTADVNGDYYATGTTINGKPVYQFTNISTSATYEMYYDNRWYIHPAGSSYNNELYRQSTNQFVDLPDGAAWQQFYGASPAPTVTAVMGTNTWTGYKAVFDAVTGTYSFESIATSGLTYSVVTPAVGNVYADGALIEAKLFTGIPTDYVVYHPLSSAEASVSGYNCSYSNVTFAQDSSLGETVAVFNGDGQLTISNVAGSPAIAFSIFQKIDTDTGDQQTVVMRDSFGFLSTPSNTGVFDFNGSLELAKQYSNTGWHHIYADYANGATRLFIDGVEAAQTTSFTHNYNDTSNVQMGVHFNGSAFPLTGKLKAFRMYNRQLSAAEISALANEFTPTA